MNLYSMIGNQTPNAIDFLGLEDLYPCKCDSDIGRFKGLSFELKSDFAGGSQYIFQDPAAVIFGYLKEKAENRSAPESSSEAVRKFNELIEKCKTVAGYLESIAVALREGSSGVTVYEIRMDVAASVCAKASDGTFGWVDVAGLGNNDNVNISIVKNPSDAAEAYKEVIVQAAERLVADIKEKTR